ncbi:MAG: TRAP transporter large permease subunit, partial [Spirochaetaceae bacterium]|nr:TRAP transporter large permease subunit [Spirochaetaceae bacterium]
FRFDVTMYPLLYGISNSWLDFSAVAIVPIVILMILLALCGVPLFIVISGIAYAAFSQGGGYVEEISLASYHILTDKSIAAIPLFTIAGYILAKGSAGKRLVEVFKSLFGWFRGGMVVAAVIVITFFTTFTGVSGVTILALGGLLTLILAGNGYNQENAESLITASGAIGLLFPPSMAIIVYGTTNYVSVNVYDLFKGALVPGILMAVSMMVIGIIKDRQTDCPKFSFPAIGGAIKHSIFELLLPVFIVVGYFAGFFSLMEVASFTVIYTFCLETFIRRDFSFRRALAIVAESVPVAGGVLIILSASNGLSVFLIDAGVPAMLSDFILSIVNSKYLFLLLLNITLLLVGCLMDIYSAILVVSPLVIPMAEMFGIHPVHIGVVFLMNLQLGFLTPPVGMDLFIASYAFDTPVMKVVKGILPYLLIQFIVLMLVTYIPFLSTILI